MGNSWGLLGDYLGHTWEILRKYSENSWGNIQRIAGGIFREFWFWKKIFGSDNFASAYSVSGGILREKFGECSLN